MFYGYTFLANTLIMKYKSIFVLRIVASILVKVSLQWLWGPDIYVINLVFLLPVLNRPYKIFEHDKTVHSIDNIIVACESQKQ